ncbi:MAG TPA: carbamoyl phosphate synthase small subunit, partial [Oceanicaulis sp.]|nr:carbamoyl phosphate synthase small subunit [Oceanicaulis sp.]
PHIGNVGANAQDEEASSVRARKAAVGMVSRATITPPASWRAEQSFSEWLTARNIVAVTGVDTRALTARIRELGMPIAAIAHSPDGKLDADALRQAALDAPDMEGAELARHVLADADSDWTESDWVWPDGPGIGPSDGPLVVV